MTDFKDLLKQLKDDLADVFDAMDWAEDEIAKACRRHPDQADLLYHAFTLIKPGDGMNVEFVYRSHAREILERVAAGEDTRLGTAAEVCLVCAKTSQLAPFHTSGVGLYMRMWMQAFPDRPVHDGQAADQVHYEALRSREIDDLEREVRRKASDPERKLGNVECRGMHHGNQVSCRYAPTDPPAAAAARTDQELVTAGSSAQATLF